MPRRGPDLDLLPPELDGVPVGEGEVDWHEFIKVLAGRLETTSRELAAARQA